MKKLISIWLSLSLCLCFLTTTTNAAATELSLQIALSPEKAVVNAGEEFSVDILATDFQGFSQLVCFGPLTFTYQEAAAEFIEFEPNSKLEMSDFTVSHKEGMVSILYVPETASSPSLVSGDALGTLRFKAKPVTNRTDLQLKVESAKGFATKDLDEVTVWSGITNPISIRPKLSQDAWFSLAYDRTELNTGEDLAVGFTVDTSKPISAFGPATITYDPHVLEYVGYCAGEGLEPDEITLSVKDGKILIVYCDSDLGTSPLSGAAEILTLNFRAKDIPNNAVQTAVTVSEIATAGDASGNEIGTGIADGGSVTVLALYRIYTKDDLNNVRYNLSGRYMLMNDIEFTETDFTEGGKFYNGGRGWEPIGGTYGATAFTGVFDGNGHVIKGLQTNISSGDLLFVGFIARNEGVIKNLGVTGGNISGTATSTYTVYAGGITGHNRGTIVNCYNGNSLVAKAGYTDAAVGGISGFNQSGTVENCFNIGVIGASATYPIAAVYVGGISGDGYKQTIRSCYNIGYVYGNAQNDFAYVGGVLGNIGNMPGGVATNCYYLDNVKKGIGKGADASIKCTKAQMMQQETFVGFDFDEVWTMAGNADYLYPELQAVSMRFEKSLISIEVSALPNKTKYLEGKEALDLAGSKLTLIYDNDTTEVLDLTPDMVSGFDNTVVGRQTLTVTYGGFTDTFEVEIVAKALSSIKLTTLPQKLAYIEGYEAFDPTGGKVTLTYNNGTSEVIDLTAEMVSGFDNAVVGKQTLTVTYGDFTDDFEVEIMAKKLSAIKLTTLPIKLEYTKEYEAFDPNGGKVTLIYNNGTSEVIDLIAEMVSGFDNTVVGKQTLTVTYGDFTDDFEVEIVDYLPGDVNGDDRVNMKDYSLLRQYLSGWDIDIGLAAANVNGDAIVNMKDLSLLRQWLNGWEVASQ